MRFHSWKIGLCISQRMQPSMDSCAARYARILWLASGIKRVAISMMSSISMVSRSRMMPRLRPNQLFAASLVHDLLSEQQVASLFQKVTNELLTPVGLRSLSSRSQLSCALCRGPVPARYGLSSGDCLALAYRCVCGCLPADQQSYGAQ